jgi:hypothetical protein
MGDWGGIWRFGWEKDQAVCTFGVGNSVAVNDADGVEALFPLLELELSTPVGESAVDRKSMAWSITTYGVSGAAGLETVWCTTSACNLGADTGVK